MLGFAPTLSVSRSSGDLASLGRLCVDSTNDPWRSQLGLPTAYACPSFVPSEPDGNTVLVQLCLTAGGVEEDFIKCLAPTYLGDFHLKGEKLRKQGGGLCKLYKCSCPT